MKSEEFQALKRGQILVHRDNHRGNWNHLLVLVTEIDYREEVCTLLVNVMEWVTHKNTWISVNAFMKEHRNKSRYACETWLDYEGWRVVNRLAFVLECGRSPESIMRECIHEELRKRTHQLQEVRESIKTEIKEWQKGIRALG